MPAAAPPPIADYALLGDCHGAALVARDGSVDWCCVPRFDAAAVFARLLDPDGGTCAVAVEGGRAAGRRYVDDTLVLETTLEAADGEARVLDLMPLGGRPGELVRIAEGVRGAATVTFSVSPRLGYGEIAPFVRHRGRGVYTATGGQDGLLCHCDAGLDDTLTATATLRAGERMRLLVAFRAPEELDDVGPDPPDPDALDAALEDTLARWREWSARAGQPEARRSAMVLKALTYEPTGAMVAAPTTSVPAGGEGRTWDYRYAWIRDSILAGECLADLGYEGEADAFRRFIDRSAAGEPADVRVCYGIRGERRLPERELGHLRGHGGAGPVRVGNEAGGQLQLDGYGHLVQQAWRWTRLGRPPDDDHWRFLSDVIDFVAERWREPDSGIWEWRGEPRHFVHSKVLCWVALDRGLELASAGLRKAPERRWRAAREEIRAAVLDQGYDERRGTFVQAFGEDALDAAVLRLPAYGFLEHRDERMLSTAGVIMEALSDNGLLRRYDADDGLGGEEGAFLACSFWLAELLSGQSRHDEARAAFDRACAAANDLGLFAEQADPRDASPLGNFPQALTHLSHVEAALALANRVPPPG